jgi:hypothetical protein
MSKTKHIDPIPDEFASYEEAGEFWDTHAITDYPEMFRAVEPRSRSEQRRTTARKHTTSIAAQREPQVKTAGVSFRGKKAVAEQLWRCVDRLDYFDYLKQAALLPQEPLTYQP